MTSRRETLALCGALAALACGPMPPMPGAESPSSVPNRDAAPAATPTHPEVLWPGAKQQTLGESRVAFARYLNGVHARIHPHFADHFLASLDELPSTDPRNAPLLTTILAFAVDGRTGRLDNVHLASRSGVPAFDAGALHSVQHAFPTPPPDPVLWSSDGKVYAYWEFHRGPEACGTWNARPFKFVFRPAVEHPSSPR